MNHYQSLTDGSHLPLSRPIVPSHHTCFLSLNQTIRNLKVEIFNLIVLFCSTVQFKITFHIMPWDLSLLYHDVSRTFWKVSWSSPYLVYRESLKSVEWNSHPSSGFGDSYLCAQKMRSQCSTLRNVLWWARQSRAVSVEYFTFLVKCFILHIHLSASQWSQDLLFTFNCPQEVVVNCILEFQLSFWSCCAGNSGFEHDDKEGKQYIF